MDEAWCSYGDSCRSPGDGREGRAGQRRSKCASWTGRAWVRVTRQASGGPSQIKGPAAFARKSQGRDRISDLRRVHGARRPRSCPASPEAAACWSPLLGRETRAGRRRACACSRQRTDGRNSGGCGLRSSRARSTHCAPHALSSDRETL